MHYLWDWAGSEAQLRHALALKTHYGHAHHWLSHLLMARGRVRESLDASLQALECDPLDVVINIHLAWHYWFAREYERALEQCERTAELDSKEHWAPMFAGFAYIERGEAAAAIDAHRTALERSNGSPVSVAALGYSYAAGGERRLAKGVLRRLQDLGAHRGMYGYEMAIIHGALGEFDVAFDQLARAQRERSTWMAYLNVDPRLDRLRSDPRFVAFLEPIGLMPAPPQVAAGAT
jgi:Flp pilus assembly protein TadD